RRRRRCATTAAPARRRWGPRIPPALLIESLTWSRPLASRSLGAAESARGLAPVRHGVEAAQAQHAVVEDGAPGARRLHGQSARWQALHLTLGGAALAGQEVRIVRPGRLAGRGAVVEAVVISSGERA